ncbi:WRKY transcription factor 38 [Hirschfeldia incana]|nr:WRKY transcription factor 38 [Hirschfeldia incana]
MNSPHEKAVQAILYGHNCAKRLKRRLEDPMADDRSISSYDLAKSIVHCFASAISILSDEPISEDDQVSDLSPMDSPPPLLQTSHSKRRSYYRCSYNIDHACGARKHEQQIKDNPPVYRTTYFGQHTCKINHNHDAVFTAVRDQVDDVGSSRIIRFGKELDQEKGSHLTGFIISVKHEESIIKEETTDQYREITSDDKDCQHVMEENKSSLSSSYTPPSSSVSETDMFDSDLLLNNLDSWDRYGLFDFGVQ